MMLRREVLLVAAAVLLSTRGPRCLADVIDVPADFPTIQQAIDAANNNDWINVAPGEYVVSEPVDFRGKRLRLESTGGPEVTIIRMANLPAVPDRASVVVFENGETGVAGITGFTLTGGGGTRRDGVLYGGGLFCNGASPSVRECRLVENSADRGGGAAWIDASGLLEDCLVARNAASYGGGVSAEGGHARLIRCLVSANLSDVGGGAHIAGDGRLWGCAIAGNMARHSGGGICCGPSPLLENVIITANRAERGGGLFTEAGGSPAVFNCTISGNAGGGAGCGDGALPRFQNCIVWGNSPQELCGGLLNCVTERDPHFLANGSFDFDRFVPAVIRGEEVELPDFIVEVPDFSLERDSPAIDAGFSDKAPIQDSQGAFRLDDPDTPDTGSGARTYYDIGAFEYTTCRLWLEETTPGAGEFTVTVVARWAVDNMQGWSWGLCHDPGELSIGECAGMEIAVDVCADIPCPNLRCPQDMREPLPGEVPFSFHSLIIDENGIRQGFILDLMTVWALPPRDRFELLEITYEARRPTAAVRFCETLGTRAVDNVFISGGTVLRALTQGITLGSAPFRRGDLNADQRVNIADTACALCHLFGEEETECASCRGGVPRCPDAADANDDGRIDIADPIRILAHLFGGGGALPPPFEECGFDPTADALGCTVFPACEAGKEITERR